MVKRSKKSKSKRIPLRKKHKIIKKVKEHHKKQKKEAKKLGHKGKPKAEKDPGIPNAWPFKEQELAALEARRARALEEIELKKAAKKERAAKRKLGLLDEDDEEFAKKVIEKPKKQKVLRPPARFYTELMKVIEASDVIIQVLDARDPLGTRCVELERLVQKAGPLKRVVLLLNKIDLVPREAVEKWLKYFREELPTVAFKCNLEPQKKSAGRKTRKDIQNDDLLQSSNCLGAETLLQLLRNYSKYQKMKTALTVGVVGFPNVGKSSIINSLKRTKAVSVQATPCITKVMQEIELDKHFKLLDCPGIFISTSEDNVASAALRDFTNVHELSDSTAPVKEILRVCPAEKLMLIYKISKFSDVDGFLKNVATVLGKSKKGVLDITAAARAVIQHWNNGKIPYYTSPPVRKVSKPSESEWKKEFDVEKALKNESPAILASLRPLIETDHIQVPSITPLAIDFDSMINASMQEDSSDDEEDEEDEDEDDDMNGVEDETLTPKTKKLKANGTKQAVVTKSKASSGAKKDSKTSDDYDFNTDYIDNGTNADDSEEEDDDEEDDDDEDEDDDEETMDD
ncbi:hypothetical protein KC19_4G083300 [Ceratodon purpureus]|uniref:CP-type G domain-containing protein n=1 Tax=Ceratodon purpureus TaxID=3225 RepID=A0A8T0I820_CERPU|nr:hypothetical protein KC19_4G083300 [Ceratodon purpureus]